MTEDRTINLREQAGGDRFDEIVSVIADGVVVVDHDGIIRFANPAAGELLGSSVLELIGRDFGFPVVVDEATEIELVARGRDPLVVEMRTVEIDWEGQPAALASLRDVTWRAQLAAEQEAAIERLRELDALKNHLARLVENILQVAQIESGKFKYDIKPFDLERLVERTVDEGRRINPHRRHDDPNLEERNIVMRIEDELPQARGDELRQWQILSNLLSNALKFSPPDEAVTVDVTRQDDEIQIAIHDHGLGIKDEDKAKLFKKFSRLEQPQGQKIKGTGLGLYICKNMIEAQGGRVWVDSRPGEGTTFFYTVPAA